MLIRDMFGLPEEEDDETVRRCYIRMLEAYRIGLKYAEGLPQETGSVLQEKYRRLEEKGTEVNLDFNPETGQPEDMDQDLRTVLHTLSYSSDIEGCRRAASGVREYLERHPGSVAGETLLEIISEQMR